MSKVNYNFSTTESNLLQVEFLWGDEGDVQAVRKSLYQGFVDYPTFSWMFAT